MDPAGKVALITGGARRVGRALSLALAEAGASVVVNYNRSRREAEELVRQITDSGGTALAAGADLAREDAAASLIREAEAAFGRLDVLVNNAATFHRSPVAEITPADWDHVLAVNLKAPFLLSQAAAPLLARDGGGVIVNIGDLSGRQVWPSYAHHGVSKAGLLHLTRILAVALAPDVRVNAIVPGTVLPPGDRSDAEARADLARTPLNRSGRPEDVAGALLYIVQSRFVTGAEIVVDGGRQLR